MPPKYLNYARQIMKYSYMTINVESKGGKLLLNYRCVTSCSTGYFESNYTKCEKFKTNCKSFNTLSECDECRVKRNE